MGEVDNYYKVVTYMGEVDNYYKVECHIYGRGGQLL